MHDNHTTRRKLVDILNGDATDLRSQWNSTTAANEFAPLPAATYETHVQAIDLFNAKSGTPGVKVTFRVCDGDHTGRLIWHDVWLTPAALPRAKRDLAKLGVTDLEQLEKPLPPGRIRCAVVVALRRSDDGAQYNLVRSFKVVAIDELAADPFAPADDPSNPSEAHATTPSPDSLPGEGSNGTPADATAWASK